MLHAADLVHRLIAEIERAPTDDSVQRLVPIFHALRRAAEEAAAAGVSQDYADDVVELARRAAADMMVDTLMPLVDLSEFLPEEEGE
jgi:hypothetical protein